MKKLITGLALTVIMPLSAQVVKQINVTYFSTTEVAGLEGACLYEISCTAEGGGRIVFTNIFHGQYNEQLMKLFCDERKLTDQEADRFNQVGKVDRTVKSSIGKKFKVKYTEGDCLSIEGAEIAAPPLDTMLIRIQKEQTLFQSKNPCPNCPIEITKPFLKAQVIKYEKQAAEEANERQRSGTIAAKNYIQEALKINSYFVYYFSNTRAALLINHKIRSKNLAVQLKKTNNKWQAIGIDDNWWSCHELNDTDAIRDENQMRACEKYFSNKISNIK